MASCQAHHFGRHHQAQHVIGQQFTDADAVRQHQVALQLSQTIGRNGGTYQLAKPGIDAVDHPILPHNIRRLLARGIHVSPGLFGERQRDATVINRPQRRQIDRAGNEANRRGCCRHNLFLYIQVKLK